MSKLAFNFIMSLKKLSRLKVIVRKSITLIKMSVRNLGLQVENNSQEEIAGAIVEMQSRSAGTWHDSVVQQQLQNQFWHSVGRERYLNVVRDKLKIKISSTFLERSLELL